MSVRKLVSQLQIMISVVTTPCFRKKTSTHIIGYNLRNSCLILIILDTKIPHIIWGRMTASCPPNLTSVSTLPCKTYRLSFIAVHYILFHRLQVVDFWHQIFTNCWNNSFQQSTIVYIVFTDMENHAGEGLLQREDCKCWRTSPAHRGRVGTSWSAHYRRRSEGVA